MPFLSHKFETDKTDSYPVSTHKQQIKQKTKLLKCNKTLCGNSLQLNWRHQCSAEIVLKDVAVDLLSHVTGGT